jgi:hypothetical protein
MGADSQNTGQLEQYRVFNSAVSYRINYLILFLLWPFLAFLFALRDYGNKESRKVVYIFLIYYGLAFVIGNEGMDAAIYALKMKEAAALPFSDFFKIVAGLYATDTSIDIVQPVISFIVSRFTTDHGYLFAAFAAVYGFFYLKSIDLLHDRYMQSPNWNAFIHLVFFVAILPIFNINGFRMWAAAWIFFYGAYHVVLYRNPKFLLVALSASLVHFSFLAADLLLLIYFFAGNRNIIYLPLLAVSFVLPSLFGSAIASYAGIFGGAFQSRYEGYSSEAYISGVEESSQQLDWFMQIGNDLVLYYLIASVIIIRILWMRTERQKAEQNLFSFLLLFLAFVNFGAVIPTFGRRFQMVFFLFATLYLFYYYCSIPDRRINLLTWIGLFPMLLFTAIVFRQGALSINAWIFAPGFGIPLLAPDFTLYDMLFG